MKFSAHYTMQYKNMSEQQNLDYFKSIEEELGNNEIKCR